MNALLIGSLAGILVIVFIAIFKSIDEKHIYSLILTGIGFIYVGFAWTDLQALVINSIQAVLFLFISYFGFKRSIHILSFGYFLHGTWDLVYHYFSDTSLIPPHYDLFCFSIDVTMGIYLVVLGNATFNNRNSQLS